MIDENNAIVKIKKLLALAGSSNENEAHASFLMAQKLLAKYKLSMDEVDNANIDNTVVEAEAEDKATSLVWHRYLAQVIARNFTCKYYGITRSGARGQKLIFVGKRDNLSVCKSVYDSAVRFIEYNFNILWSVLKIHNALPQCTSRVAKSDYAQGFILALEEKFKAQLSASENASMALVILKDKDVDNYMDTIKGLKVRNTRTMDFCNREIACQGYSDCKDKYGDTGQKHVKHNNKGE